MLLFSEQIVLQFTETKLFNYFCSLVALERSWSSKPALGRRVGELTWQGCVFAAVLLQWTPCSLHGSGRSICTVRGHARAGCRVAIESGFDSLVRCCHSDLGCVPNTILIDCCGVQVPTLRSWPSSMAGYHPPELSALHLRRRTAV